MSLQDKSREQEFFDAYAEQQDYDVFTPRTYRRLIKELNQVRSEIGGWQVDIGCGTGAFTKYIATAPYRTIAVDLSYKCLQKVQSGVHDVTPIQGDLEKLPFTNNALDVIVLSGVLHHFSDLTTLVSELYRVLKPGGCGFAYDPNEINPLMWLFRSSQSPIHSKQGRTQNERNLTQRELKTMFKQAGFQVHVVSISGILYKHVPGQHHLAVRLYNLFELALEFTCLDYFIGSFLLTKFRKPSI